MSGRSATWKTASSPDIGCDGFDEIRVDASEMARLGKPNLRFRISALRCRIRPISKFLLVCATSHITRNSKLVPSHCPSGQRNRSEERRVGKECRYRWSPYAYNKESRQHV